MKTPLKSDEVFKCIDPKDRSFIWVGPSGVDTGKKVELAIPIKARQVFRMIDPADRNYVWFGWNGLAKPWLGKSKFRVMYHGEKAKPLHGIYTDAVIYVVGHTYPGAPTISDDKGATLTADALAKRLIDDGLSKLHKVIKLYTCSGGKADDSGNASFASRLLAELRKLDCKMLTLYAYTETMAYPPADYYPASGANAPGVTKFAKIPTADPNVITTKRAKDVRIQVT